MTVARTGPTSAMSAKNRRNATAVHTTASPTTDHTTFSAGTADGKANAANGAYATAAIVSDAATTPIDGAPASQRESTIGPSA
jgi:hypothetical protein